MIEVRNISKNLGGRIILQGVSFQVSQGTIYGILGRNGAGKSTLLRILTGIFEPDEGTVVLSATFSYMPEERCVKSEMTVRDFLVFWGRLKGLNKTQALTEAMALIESLQLSDFIHKKIKSMSKGMQQRVQVASAFIANTPIVILDEPFSGLDVESAEVVSEMIESQKQQGKTILISSHNMEYVHKLCNQVLILNQRTVTFIGTIAEMLEEYSPLNTYEVLLKGNVFIQLLGIDVQDAVLKNGNSYFKLKAQSNISRSEVLQQMMACGEVLSFAEFRYSLKQIFLQITE